MGSAFCFYRVAGGMQDPFENLNKMRNGRQAKSGEFGASPKLSRNCMGSVIMEILSQRHDDVRN